MTKTALILLLVVGPITASLFVLGVGIYRAIIHKRRERRANIRRRLEVVRHYSRITARS